MQEKFCVTPFLTRNTCLKTFVFWFQKYTYVRTNSLNVGQSYINEKQKKTTCSELTITMYKICSKLTIKTPKWHHWWGSSVFIVNFEHISFTPCSTVTTVNFEQLIADWVESLVQFHAQKSRAETIPSLLVIPSHLK